MSSSEVFIDGKRVAAGLSEDDAYNIVRQYGSGHTWLVATSTTDREMLEKLIAVIATETNGLRTMNSLVARERLQRIAFEAREIGGACRIPNAGAIGER